MFLKVSYDGSNLYFNDVCKKLYCDGYDVQAIPVAGSLGCSILSSMSYFPEIAEKYLSIHFCNPDNIELDVLAEFSISFLSTDVFPISERGCDLLSSMDIIFVGNSLSERTLVSYGIPKDKIRVAYYYAKVLNARRDNGGKIGYCYDGDMEGLTSLINELSSVSKESSLLVGVVRGDFDIKKIKLRLTSEGASLNSFDIKYSYIDDFRGMLSECGMVVFTKKQNFDRNVLNCMASGVLVVAPRCDNLSDYCSGSHCVMYDDIVGLSNLINVDEGVASRKITHASKLYSETMSENRFFKSLKRQIDKFGATKLKRIIPNAIYFKENPCGVII